MHRTYALVIGLCCLLMHAIDVRASSVEAEAAHAQSASDATTPKKKLHSPVPHQTPPEVSGVEHWYKADKNDHIYVGFVIDQGSVCGLIYSTSNNTNRLDRSLLVGKYVADRIEVQYASSYYSEQREVAKATIEHYNDHVVWHSTDPKLPSSWIWDQATLSSFPSPYIPLTQEHLNRCRLIRAKAAIEALKRPGFRGGSNTGEWSHEEVPEVFP